MRNKDKDRGEQKKNGDILRQPNKPQCIKIPNTTNQLLQVILHFRIETRISKSFQPQDFCLSNWRNAYKNGASELPLERLYKTHTSINVNHLWLKMVEAPFETRFGGGGTVHTKAENSLGRKNKRTQY